MFDGVRGLVAGGLAILVAGCAVNPAFSDSEPGTTGAAGSMSVGSTSGTESTETATAGPTTTSMGATTGGTATGATSTGIELTTTGEVSATTTIGETTDTGSTTELETSDTSSSSGPPMEVMVEIVADIATCVLLPFNALPHGGPAECEDLVTKELMVPPDQTYGMIVDQSFNDAGGRAARVYMRFDLSSIPPGAQLLAATLELQVVLPLMKSGQLWRSESFDAAMLATGAPGLLDGEVDLGATMAGQILQVALLGTIPQPTPPWLYLGIAPQDPNPVVYMNRTSSSPPKLKIVYLQ